MAITKKIKRLTLGHKISLKREQLKITQKNICDELGLSISYVSKVERDEIKPSRKTAIKIADMLGMDIVDFGYVNID